MLQTKHLYAVALFCTFGWELTCLPVNSSCANGLVSSINKNIVLIPDSSASMASQDRLKEVASVLKEWILSTAPCYAHLAIVGISSRAQVLSNLTEVNDESRSELAEKIPLIPQGETCISCGLKKAKEVLGDERNATENSVIVLITDADVPKIDLDDDIIQSLEASKLHVVAAVLSDGADKLEDIEKLTKRTRGFSRYIQDEHIFKDLMEVLILVGTPEFGNVTTTVPTETTAISIPILNDTTTSILLVSTLHTLSENSTRASVTPIEETTVDKNLNNVTTVGESIDSTISFSTVSYSAKPSVKPFESNATETSPTNTTSAEEVEAGLPWFYITWSAITTVVIIVVIVVINCLWCKKRERCPGASRERYAPMSQRVSRAVHGDHVLANFNSRPDDSFS